MAWVVTDHGSKTTTGGAACTLNPTATIAAGTLVVIATMERTGTNTVPSVTDSKGNTYTEITQQRVGGSTNGFVAVWWSVLTTQLTTADTWTYTPVTSANDNAMEVLSATGNAGSPVDSAVTAAASGSYTTSAGTTLSVISGTPVASGELFVCFGGDTNSARSINVDAVNSWAAPFDNNVTSDGGGGTTTGVAVGGGNQVNAGTGTKTYTPTVTGGSPDAASIIVGFKTTVLSTAAFAGAGNLNAATLVFSFTNPAAFAGAGSFSATIVSRLVAASTLAGAGSLSALTSLVGPITATFSGAGSLSANLIKAGLIISARFNGTGSLSASVRQAYGAFATFQGAGTLRASTTAIINDGAIFAGAGKLCAQAWVYLGPKGTTINISRTGPGPTNNVVV